MAAIPSDARLVNDQLLEITWSDGVVLHYPTDHLRVNCPCAHCNEGPDPVRGLARGVFAGVKLDALETVGSYAFRIAFSDGHRTGIYGFPSLRSLGFAPDRTPPPSQSPHSPFDV